MADHTQARTSIHASGKKGAGTTSATVQDSEIVSSDNEDHEEERDDDSDDDDVVEGEDVEPDTRADLADGIKNLQLIHTNLIRGGTVKRALLPLRNAWRDLIRLFCRQTRPESFPRWILRTVSEESVLACLEAEFGRPALNQLWREKYRRRGHQCKLRELLGLTYVETLALWFGADEARWPRRNTLGAIWKAIPQDDGAAQFNDRIYPTIIERYAKRLDYDLDIRRNRERVVFARHHMRGEDGPSIRLMPRDVSGLDGQNDEEAESGDDQEDAEDEDAEVDQDHQDGHDGQDAQDDQDPQDDQGDQDGHAQTKTGDGNRSLRESIEDMMEPSERGRAGSTSTGRDLAITPLGDAVQRGSSVEESDVRNPGVRLPDNPDQDFQLSFTPHWSATHSPKGKRRRSRSSSSQPARKRPDIPSVPATPCPDRLSGPSLRGASQTSQDTTFFPALEENVHAVSDNEQQLAEEQAMTDEQQLAKEEAMTDEQQLAKEEAMTDDKAEESFFNVDEMKSLETEDGWLNDNMMDGFVELFAFANGTTTCISNYVLDRKSPPGNPLEVNPLRVRFYSPSPLAVKRAMIATHIDGNHWVLVNLHLLDNSCVVFDSRLSDHSIPDVQSRLVSLMPLLDNARGEFRLIGGSCPQQTDTSSCGIHAIICACFLATGTHQIPATVDSHLWRKLFLAMARKTSLKNVLPPSVIDVDAAVQASVYAGDADMSMEDQTQLPQREAGGLGHVQALYQQSEQLRVRADAAARACAEVYRSRGDEVKRVLSWLQEEVEPVLSTLAMSAADETKRLPDTLAKLAVDLREWEGIKETTEAAEERMHMFKSGTIEVKQQADTQIHLIKKHRKYQSLRLDRVQLLVRLLGKLDLDGLSSCLELTLAEYERMATLATTMCSPF
jgi:hypothetical protein